MYCYMNGYVFIFSWSDGEKQESSNEVNADITREKEKGK